MGQKILLFESRQLCYESNRYFMHRLEEALKSLGCPVFRCDVSEEYEAQLEELLQMKEQFFAALDFNSLLPRMVMEDGTPYLNRLGIPFYNYLVDHPMYHHPGLVQPIDDYHVICIDECHRAYVEQYYPNIKSVHVLPLGSMEALSQRSLKQKRFELLFLGTYFLAEKIYREIEELECGLRAETKNLIERMESDVELTQEGALKAYLEERGEKLDDAAFAIRLNRACLADRYIRYSRRQNIVCAAAKADIPFTIIGHGWESVDFLGSRQPELKKGVRFFATADLIADAKILLNVTPAFHGGMHDRVFSAMQNGAVCLTEGSRFARENFRDKEEIVLYGLKELDRLPEQIYRLWKDANLQQKIRENAWVRAKEQFTWKVRAGEMLDFFHFSGKIT